MGSESKDKRREHLRHLKQLNTVSLLHQAVVYFAPIFSTRRPLCCSVSLQLHIVSCYLLLFTSGSKYHNTLYFYHKLQNSNVDDNVMKSFYHCFIKLVLTLSFISCYRLCILMNRIKLHGTVKVWVKFAVTSLNDHHHVNVDGQDFKESPISPGWFWLHVWTPPTWTTNVQLCDFTFIIHLMSIEDSLFIAGCSQWSSNGQ